MRMLRKLRARWKARRLRLAVSQMEADASSPPEIRHRGAAFGRLSKSESRTEWRGD